MGQTLRCRIASQVPVSGCRPYLFLAGGRRASPAATRLRGASRTGSEWGGGGGARDRNGWASVVRLLFWRMRCAMRWHDDLMVCGLEQSAFHAGRLASDGLVRPKKTRLGEFGLILTSLASHHLVWLPTAYLDVRLDEFGILSDRFGIMLTRLGLD